MKMDEALVEKWAEILHSAFCNRQHLDPTNPNAHNDKRTTLCKFHVEHVYTDRWTHPDHRHWAEAARTVLYEAESEQQLADTLYQLRVVRDNLELISRSEPHLAGLCFSFVKDFVSPVRGKPKE